MITTLCVAPNCGQPRPEHAWLCNDCVRVLREHLRSIPALVHDLNTTISRQDKLGTDGGRPSAETALPFKPAAAEVLWVLADTVTSWVRVLLEDTRQTLQNPGDPAVCARWLLQHVQSLAMHEAAGEAYGDLDYAVHQVYMVIDRPPAMLFAGPCRMGECSAYLYARPGAVTCECGDCGTVYDVAERREWMIDAAAEQRVTATVALSWVRLLMGKSVPESTWRSWLHRGSISAHTTSHLGHALYRFGDVRDLAVRHVARGQAA